MKIVAIGGGEIGRPGYPVETTKIDQEIINLTGKSNPKLLFLPTASGDNQGYIDIVNEHFGKRLGCKVDSLLLLNRKVTRSELEEKVFGSDIVYVGGGNTLKMMNIWRRTGLGEVLKRAAKKDIVLSGLSAGAICWFKFGSSDSRRFYDPNAPLIKVRGLNLIPTLFCPHYDVEEYRKIDLKELMKKTPGVALAADNCCAIEVIDDKYRIISSKDTAKAYKVYWKNGEYKEEELDSFNYQPLSNIIRL